MRRGREGFFSQRGRTIREMEFLLLHSDLARKKIPARKREKSERPGGRENFHSECQGGIRKVSRFSVPSTRSTGEKLGEGDHRGENGTDGSKSR